MFTEETSYQLKLITLLNWNTTSLSLIETQYQRATRTQIIVCHNFTESGYWTLTTPYGHAGNHVISENERVVVGGGGCKIWKILRSWLSRVRHEVKAMFYPIAMLLQYDDPWTLLKLTGVS